MLNIGPQELLLILVVALIVVGPTRLPELGRSIGKGLREIRKAQDEVKRTIQVNLDEPPAPKKASKPGSPQPAAETPGTDTGGLVAEGVEGGPPAVGPDPVPLASEPAPKSEVLEISRTLGRSLAELRRAKEEVQKSFRVDLADERASRPTPKPAGDPAPVARPSDVAPAGPSPADETPTG